MCGRVFPRRTRRGLAARRPRAPPGEGSGWREGLANWRRSQRAEGRGLRAGGKAAVSARALSDPVSVSSGDAEAAPPPPPPAEGPREQREAPQLLHRGSPGPRRTGWFGG